MSGFPKHRIPHYNSDLIRLYSLFHESHIVNYICRTNILGKQYITFRCHSGSLTEEITELRLPISAYKALLKLIFCPEFSFSSQNPYQNRFLLPFWQNLLSTPFYEDKENHIEFFLEFVGLYFRIRKVNGAMTESTVTIHVKEFRFFMNLFKYNKKFYPELQPEFILKYTH